MPNDILIKDGEYTEEQFTALGLTDTNQDYASERLYTKGTFGYFVKIEPVKGGMKYVIKGHYKRNV